MEPIKQQKILAVETCTMFCSVALWTGEAMIEEVIKADRSHSQKILPMCQQVLSEAGLSMNDLDAIACTRGPGAFTGLRIGVGVAKGLAFGQNLPIYAVSSLQAVAYQVIQSNPNASRIGALLDARMGELYYGVYDNQDGYPLLHENEQLITTEKLNVEGQLFAGTGVLEYASELNDKGAHVTNITNPLASDIIGIIHTGNVEASNATDLSPLYLRDNVTY